MADKGDFRTAINGFNKADVLEYIDAMQSRYTEESNISQKQINDMRNSLSNRNRENDLLKNDIDQLNNQLRILEEENGRLKQTTQERLRYAADIRRLAQEVEILRLEKRECAAKLAEIQDRSATNDELERQIEALRAQTESNAAMRQNESGRLEELNSELERLRSENEQLSALYRKFQLRSEELEKQLSEVGEANQRYNGLVGDAGAFILEMYSMGQRFLEIAFKRSDGCLDSMEDSLNTLSAQAAEAREKVKGARQELLDYGALAGLRLDELMQSLENSAGVLSNPGENGISAADKETRSAV